VDINIHFSRLNQISTILSFEKVRQSISPFLSSNLFTFYDTKASEVMLIDRSVGWTLSPNEIRLILSKRMEFSGEEIASLRL